MTHIKVPKDRVGAIIGPKGRVKQIIEERSTASLDIDSEEGTVEIIPGEDPVGAMKAEDVINAIARGFNPDKTFSMFDDDMLMLEIIDLSKHIGTSKELLRLKGRIIGKGGKTREITERLIGVKISVYGKTVSIIGTPEQNQIARTSIEMLIDGANHGSVYSYLEKKRQEMLQSQLDYY
ncbi:KH domain-containing protein [Methanolobus bombayensis]|uniref:KH domain-containing protein n=1 Tax=Methanolobus bombayensis TaxID=38023 RepID=UPI001AE67309|nr:KH domain-containing protein [Methanolobus bombayensis]MBP1910040.1 ribosomal RNA assembly protein [Methanolobus bombayensis]